MRLAGVTGPAPEPGPRRARQRAMPVNRPPRLVPVLAVGLVLVLAACTAGASPSPSASSGSPGASFSASPIASAGPSAGPVGSAEEAVALVLASDPRFANVGPFDPDLIGQSAWYTVDPASDGWTVVVQIGWGDCPSGCIDKHTWTYAVSTSGEVTLMTETRSVRPGRPARVAAIGAT